MMIFPLGVPYLTGKKKGPPMRKIVLIYGALSGFIMACLTVVSMSLLEKGIMSFDYSEVIGYSSMIIVLSLIFFGIKSYRDNYQNGTISFGKGVQIGMLIAAIATVMYASGWEVYYRNSPGVEETFMDKYTELRIAKLKHEGATQEEIDKTLKELTEMKEMYKNPLIRFGITMTEILPVGVIIALISAAILRRKEVLPA